MQGDIGAGRALAQQGLTEARSLVLRCVKAGFFQLAATAALLHGDTVGFIDLIQQVPQVLRETGDRVNGAIGLSTLRKAG